MITVVPQILATLTVVANILAIALLILFIAEKSFKNKILTNLRKNYGKYRYIFVFIITLTAMLGSLFFSEVAKFQPCILCWYQRICMYPQPFLTYIAIVRNEFTLTPYLLAMNGVGAIIAIYHYILQKFPYLHVVNCSASGGVSCIKGYTFYYGYISIPFMALSAFVLNILILTLLHSKVKTSVKK